MTDYSVTISEEIRSFGGGPTSKWNEVTWNNFKWGANTLNVLHDVDHYIPESLASTDYRINSLEKGFSSETITPSDAATHALDVVLGNIAESIASSDGMSVARMDEAGIYTYTRADETSFSATSANATSWTEVIPNATSWTED